MLLPCRICAGRFRLLLLFLILFSQRKARGHSFPCPPRSGTPLSVRRWRPCASLPAPSAASPLLPGCRQGAFPLFPPCTPPSPPSASCPNHFPALPPINVLRLRSVRTFFLPRLAIRSTCGRFIPFFLLPSTYAETGTLTVCPLLGNRQARRRAALSMETNVGVRCCANRINRPLDPCRCVMHPPTGSCAP